MTDKELAIRVDAYQQLYERFQPNKTAYVSAEFLFALINAYKELVHLKQDTPIDAILYLSNHSGKHLTVNHAKMQAARQTIIDWLDNLQP